MSQFGAASSSVEGKTRDRTRFSTTRKVMLLAPISCIASVLLAGCQQKPKVAADQPVPVQIRTPNHYQQPVSVFASGSVEANVTALAAFQVTGRVTRVNVEEGQYVQKGQVLAELDSTDYRNNFDAAAGQASAADANALAAKNGTRAEDLEQARVNFERAQDEYERQKYLYDNQSLAANDFHKIEAAYLDAQQVYKLAREGVRAEQKQAAISQAFAADAQLSEAKKRLSDCQLRAPISGFVGMRHVDVGDTVAAGNPVFSVLDLDSVKIRVGIPEAEIGPVHGGARAVVTIPSLGDQRFEGRVDTVGVSADQISRTFATKIVVPNPKHILKAGMVSESRVYGTVIVDALTVPGAAIVRDPRGVPMVYVYDGTRGRVFGDRVDLGELIDGEVVIKSGVGPSDHIVVAGQQNVREGSEVNIAGGGQ